MKKIPSFEEYQITESTQDVSDQIIDAAIEIDLAPSQFVHTIKGKTVDIEFGSNVKTNTVSKFAEALEKMGLSVKAHRGGLSVYESVSDELNENQNAMKTSELEVGMVVKTNAKSLHLSGGSGTSAWYGGNPERIEHKQEKTKTRSRINGAYVWTKESMKRREEASKKFESGRRLPSSFTVIRLNRASAVLQSNEAQYNYTVATHMDGSFYPSWEGDTADQPKKEVVTINFNRQPNLTWELIK